MIIVHHLNQSRSHRVIWLLEELGLPYEVRRYERDPRTLRAPPELARIHPLGKSPVVTDGDRVVAESAVILDYLVERAGGRLRPALGGEARAKYDYWMHYAEGSLMPQLLLALAFQMVKKAPMPFFVRPLARAISNGALKTQIQPQLKIHFDYLESQLSHSDWFAGSEFTAADIQLSFPIEAARERGGFGDEHRRLADFLKRIRERPAYQRALPYRE